MNLELAHKEIQTIVVAFYQKAIKDVIIGYHFRHIEDFSLHIPRIITFWKWQLLGISLKNQGTEKTQKDRELQGSPGTDAPFHLIQTHRPLKIKKGEVGRWIILFEATLEAHPLQEISKKQWRRKLRHFRQVFLNHPDLT